ncbi:hypothetical protein GCM10011576_37140 [Micromonospora parathelypteridis]|nr:hypothetical protein GCM10011576_37140 [Micromonospora parathelypteridis]
MSQLDPVAGDAGGASQPSNHWKIYHRNGTYQHEQGPLNLRATDTVIEGRQGSQFRITPETLDVWGPEVIDIVDASKPLSVYSQ